MLRITLCLALQIVFLCSDAFCVSKHLFPDINEKDFIYHLKKQDSLDDPHFFLYSSFSLLGLDKNSVNFNLSRYPALNIIPFISTPIYPSINSVIRSENLDYTIWGHLGKYFNKNIEVVELENEIRAILDELNGVNQRYVYPKTKIFSYKLRMEKIITINRYNYFVKPDNYPEYEEPEDIADTNTYKLNRKREEHHLRKDQLVKQISSMSSERLNTKIVKASNLRLKDDTFSSEEFRRDGQIEISAKLLKDIDTDRSYLVDRLFNYILNIPYHIVNNKIVSLVLLFFAFFLINLIKIITQGR